MLFFVFFCVRRVAGVSALFWPVLPSHLFAGVLASLYVRLGRLSPCLPVAGLWRVSSPCRGLRPVGVVGSVGLFVCVIAWRFVCLSKRGRLSPCRAVCVRLSGVRTSVRLGSFEQVFETSVLMPFWASLSEFLTESEPNFDFVALCV